MFQFFKGGFPGGTYSIDNASATFHDAHITVAVEPPDEFVGAKSSENQMGMRVNESWQQYIPSGVKYFIAGLFMAYTVFANIGNNTVGYSTVPQGMLRSSFMASPFRAVLPCGVTMWALMIIKLLLITLFLFIP